MGVPTGLVNATLVGTSNSSACAAVVASLFRNGTEDIVGVGQVRVCVCVCVCRDRQTDTLTHTHTHTHTRTRILTSQPPLEGRFLAFGNGFVYTLEYYCSRRIVPFAWCQPGAVGGFAFAAPALASGAAAVCDESLDALTKNSTGESDIGMKRAG